MWFETDKIPPLADDTIPLMLLRDDSDEAMLYCLDGVGFYDGTKFIHYEADGTAVRLTVPPKRWMFAYSRDLQEYVLSLLPGRQPTPTTELPCDYYTYDVTVPRKGSKEASGSLATSW